MATRLTTLVSTPTMFELRPLLKSWVSVCRTYGRCVDGDDVWHYHERAQTGFLAAAAWKARGVALEEWRTEKKSPNGDSRDGRGDLWIQLEDVCAHIEAKHVWCPLSNNVEREVERIKASLGRARHDACEISCGPGERRLGVLFAAPIVRRTAISNGKSQLDSWLAGLQRSRLNFAWAMDSQCWRSKGNDDVVPGVALLVGRARRAA
jgi:hypothetical protein